MFGEQPKPPRRTDHTNRALWILLKLGAPEKTCGVVLRVKARRRVVPVAHVVAEVKAGRTQEARFVDKSKKMRQRLTT